MGFLVYFIPSIRKVIGAHGCALKKFFVRRQFTRSMFERFVHRNNQIRLWRYRTGTQS
jgi:hypothetical protein